MKYYPIAVRLKDKKAVVVGGGNVAERKVLGLLRAGARVKVVSPRLTGKLSSLAGKKKIFWEKRAVRRTALEKADIVIAATSDHAVNKKISAWSRASGKSVNVVDDKNLSDFISPAVFNKEKAIVAVYTDGLDPKLSRDLKKFLREYWDEFLSFRDRS